MKFTIQEMKKEHFYGKSYVHYTSWNETYKGLISDDYLNTRSIEKCLSVTEKYPENTLVAVVDDKVVGFACYLNDSRVSNEYSEIMALYVLKDYQKLGIGRSLLENCLSRLPKKDVILYVLRDNENAISFYKHLGFTFTGVEKKERILNIELEELEMILKRG